MSFHVLRPSITLYADGASTTSFSTTTEVSAGAEPNSTLGADRAAVLLFHPKGVFLLNAGGAVRDPSSLTNPSLWSISASIQCEV